MSQSVNEEIYYRHAIGGDFGLLPPSDVSDYFGIVTTQNTVGLSHNPFNASPVWVFKNNSLLLYNTDYTVSGQTVTFVVNLTNGDQVIVNYNI